MLDCACRHGSEKKASFTSPPNQAAAGHVHHSIRAYTAALAGAVRCRNRSSVQPVGDCSR